MQKRILIIALLLNLFFVVGTYSQPGKPVALKVAKNGFDLQLENGTPFFWLGDTAWELFHRLILPEIKLYLQNRPEKGFNVIQAVVLAEFDGLRIPNRYGQLPYLNLFLALLPTWGDKVTPDWGAGPVIFDSAWGISESSKGKQLITYHPSGGSQSTSQWIHNEPWLDVNMFQSGHGGGRDVPCWGLVIRDRKLQPSYPDRGWLNALNRPDAFQAGYLRKLIESRPFVNRVPDQATIKEGQGIKSEYMAAFPAFDNSYGMVYLPVGKKITRGLGWLKSESITATNLNSQIIFK